MKHGIDLLKYSLFLMLFVFVACSSEESDLETLEKTNLNASTSTCDADGFLYNLKKWKPKGESGDARAVCDRIGAEDCSYSIKFEGGSGIFGYHEIELGGITITQEDDGSISWQSHGSVKICRVMVKAGPGANVYGYGCEDTCGTNLHTPDNKDVSHITICYRDRSIYCPV